jgi:hypothetical protein
LKKHLFFGLGILIILWLFYPFSAFGSSLLEKSGKQKAEISDQEIINTPYVLELNSQKGCLLYYGACHIQEPDDFQFSDIEEKWRKFNPNMSFSEGGTWPREESRKKAIEKHGEQGLLRYLAARDKVKIRCIEPSRYQEALYLTKYFSPVKIKIFYVLRQAAINRNFKRAQNDFTFVNFILTDLSKLPTFRVPPYGIKDFKASIRHHFPNMKNWRSPSMIWFWHKNVGKWLPDIHQKVNEFRDQYMIKRLIGAVKRGNRVFALVGCSHVVLQEPVLRSRLTDNTSK